MKVTVLSRCAAGENFAGYSHDSKVVLHIGLGDYSILAKILCKNIETIFKYGNWGLFDGKLRDSLLRDVRTVRTILEKSEKEVLK